MANDNVSSFSKNIKFQRTTDNPRIEVLRFSKATKTMEICSFYASAVLMRPVGTHESAIVLPDGTTVILSLPYADLVEKIDEGYSPLDLKEHCSTVVSVIEPHPGEMIAGEGIFLGKYKPRDRDGNSLGKIFNVFAAPEDLGGAEKYVDTVKHIAALKNWHGHDGTNYATDKELYQALKNGGYNGGWIIPTRPLLSGRNVNDIIIQPDNLYAHKDKGALAETFKTAASDSSRCYWSSTEDRDYTSHVYAIRFSDGHEGRDLEDYFLFSCRPVRLVPA